MEKSILMKKIIWGFGLAALCFTAQLPAFFGDGCCEDGPLACNSFGMQVKGGVTPSHFTHHGNLLLTNPSLPVPVFSAGGARFKDIYETPWEVDVELIWNASTHVQFFAEYVYEQAKGKRHDFTADGTAFTFRLSKLETNSFYLGSRYFFGNVWCDPCMGSIAPFVGTKAGFVWQNENSHHMTAAGADVGSFSFNRRQAAVSVGAQLGLDWSIDCNWGVVFTAEAVATQGFNTNRNQALTTALPGGVTNIGIGDTGRLISYPVTLGVRYTF